MNDSRLTTSKKSDSEETIAKRIIQNVIAIAEEKDLKIRRRMARQITADIPDLEVAAHEDGMNVARAIIISSYGRDNKN